MAKGLQPMPPFEGPLGVVDLEARLHHPLGVCLREDSGVVVDVFHVPDLRDLAHQARIVGNDTYGVCRDVLDLNALDGVLVVFTDQIQEAL